MESFEQLVAQYNPMIHKIIRSLHLYTNKDEFYQQALIALWEASHRFNPEKGNFTNYAYTYIRGSLLVEIKKMTKVNERNFCPVEEFWETAVADSHPSESIEKEILLSSSHMLTPNQRKWLTYTVRSGLSIKEIAEREGVTVSAVKQWRSGAREKLKKWMSDY